MLLRPPRNARFTRCALLGLLIASSAPVVHADPQSRVTDWRLQLSSSGEIAAAHLPPGSPGHILPRVEPDQWVGFGKLPGGVQINLQALSANVRANDPTGDAGPPAAETQSEVAVAAWNQYVVVAWNDSKGFTAGFTLSSYAFSSDYGQSFTDGGNVPLITAGDQAFGDCTLGVDDLGNFYLGAIYTTGGAQDCAVWRGSFSGVLFSWNTPVIAAVSTAADKPSIAVDPYDNYVYCAYTDFGAGGEIRVVRSSNQGASWGAPVTLSAASGASGARPWVGPDHEVYVVWEEGWGVINCDLSNTTGSIAYSVSANHGTSWSAGATVGSTVHYWTSYGPGDIRGRARSFPDIAIDRSSGPYRKTVYVTWNESASWGAPGTGTGVSVAEGNNTTNDLPSGATLFALGDNLTGSVSAQANNDYFRVSLTLGQHCLLRLEPQGFNCGVTGTSRDMMIRLYPTPANTGVSPPDTMLAFSELNGFAGEIHFDCPKTGTYYLRVRGGTATGGLYTGTYTVKTRSLTYTSPNATTPARDQRDIVLVRRPLGAGAWSAKARLNDDPANLDNSIPFITCDEAGKVHAFWFDGRESGTPGPAILGAGSLTDIYTARSADGGATWSANQRVSDESSLFNFNTAAVPNRGDYNTAYAAGQSVYAAWSDERLSHGATTGVDAYTARIDTEVRVDCPPDAKVCPCDSVLLAFTVNNVGTVEGDVHYSIGDALAWCAPLAGTVHLPGGQSTVVEWACLVPCDIKLGGSDTLTAVIYPVIDPTRADTCGTIVTVSPGPQASLTCAPDTTAARGDSLYLELAISNTGACGGPFCYQVFDDLGWFAGSEDSVVIGPGGTLSIFASGQVPDTLKAGATDQLHLVVLPKCDPAQAESCTVTITVLATPRVSLQCPPDTSGAPGDTLHLSFLMTVKGGTGDVVMCVSDGEGWTVSDCDTTALAIGLHKLFLPVAIANSATSADSDTVVFVVYPLGGGAWAETCLVVVTVSTTTGVPEGAGPAAYRLFASQPNPAAARTSFAFELPRADRVTIRVFDTSGRAVRTVVDRQSFPAGRQTREWDLRSDSGRRVPPGIYFYQMSAGSYVGKRAVVVLK